MSTLFSLRRGRWGAYLAFAAAILMTRAVSADTSPLIEFLFSQGTGTSVTNTGSVNGSASFTSTAPAWSPNTAIHAAPFSVDFGSSGSGKAVEMAAPAALKNLKSFTIAGWINRRKPETGEYGDRLLTWHLADNHGVDLSYRSDGSLRLGVNEWGEDGGASSSGGKILVDANASYNNWRFFAVTYDSELASEQVKFYFGTPITNAVLDRSATYDQGQVGANIAAMLSVGHYNSTALRSANTPAQFKGLVDQIRIFGTGLDDGSGALTESQIVILQNALPPDGRAGLLYEAWDNIGTGSNVSDLTGHSAFQGNPSYTGIRTSFDAPENRAAAFGARMSGWIKAPSTGNYTFWIASDDHGELRLSTDANPFNKALIASVTGYTDHMQWTKYASQKSEALHLDAGKYYYIEALMKESGGSDNLSVGWHLPQDAANDPIQIIPGGVVFLSPEESSALFPSTTHLYEQGTMTKRATLGWQKETGRDHFFLETEGEKKLLIHNDVVNIPKKLYFGGLLPEEQNIGLRWEPNTSDGLGFLYLEAQNSKWALRVTGASEDDPVAEFNQRLKLVGPDMPEQTGVWSGDADLHYYYGLGFDRSHFTAMGVDYENSLFNGSVLSMQQGTSENGVVVYSQGMELRGGSLELVAQSLDEPYTARMTLNTAGLNYAITQDGETKGTIISPFGVHTDVVTAESYVSTPKWRVEIPDYVFEEGYKRRSLEEIERFVKTHKHLPDVPGAKQLKEKGMDLAEMNLHLLKSIEELTLHVIELNKELQAEKSRNIRRDGGMKAARSKKEGK